LSKMEKYPQMNPVRIKANIGSAEFNTACI